MWFFKVSGPPAQEWDMKMTIVDKGGLAFCGVDLPCVSGRTRSTPLHPSDVGWPSPETAPIAIPARVTLLSRKTHRSSTR